MSLANEYDYRGGCHSLTSMTIGGGGTISALEGRFLRMDRSLVTSWLLFIIKSLRVVPGLIICFLSCRDEICQSFILIQAFNVGLVKKFRQYFFPTYKEIRLFGQLL